MINQNINIAVLGCSGRMGQLVMQECLNDPQINLVGGSIRPGSYFEDKDLGIILNNQPLNICATADINKLFKNADCLIDFSHPEALNDHLTWACKLKKALIIAVTGFTDQQHYSIAEAAKNIPILVAANTSLAMTLLIKLVEEAARQLPHIFDIDIVDTHHRHKKDAPSGTSLSLGAAVNRGHRYDKLKNYFIDVSVQNPRPDHTIAYSAIRAGGYPGEHSVLFSSAMEVLELKHRCLDRRVYAQGALYASKWLVNQPAGLYSMNDL